MKRTITMFIATLMMLATMLPSLASAAEVEPMRYEPCSCGGMIVVRESYLYDGEKVTVKCPVNPRFNCTRVEKIYASTTLCISCGRVYSPVHEVIKYEYLHNHSAGR